VDVLQGRKDLANEKRKGERDLKTNLHLGKEQKGIGKKESGKSKTKIATLPKSGEPKMEQEINKASHPGENPDSRRQKLIHQPTLEKRENKQRKRTYTGV